MSSPRDPWLAANLSWSFAGLGQFYAGRKRAGVVFLAMEILLWLTYVGWALSSSVGTLILVGTLIGITGNWIVSSILAFRAVRTQEPRPAAGAKSPWKSLFLTRFILGTGHFYGGRWIRGVVLLGVMGFFNLWEPAERWMWWSMGAYSLVRVLGFLDSFLILRGQNIASPKLSMAALALALAGSQLWLVALLAKTHVAEVFKIPSSAMEPTLIGGVSETHSRDLCPFESYHLSPSGDRILVSKLAYAVGEIRRFDVAVFRFPLNQSKYFVKRVVGMPGEEIVIHRGDLYARPPGEPKFRLVRKPMEVQDRIWIRPHGGADDTVDLKTLEQYWELDLGDVSIGPEGGVIWPTQRKIGWAKLREPLGDSFVGPVRDQRIAFEVRAPGEQDEILIRMKTGHGEFELKISTTSKGELRLRRAGKNVASVPLPTLPRNHWCTLELLVFDGQAIARRDSQILGQFEFIESLEDDKGPPEAAGELSLGARGAGLTIRRLQVARDLHYKGKDHDDRINEDEPVAVPAGHYLMFGDNVTNSHDSRAWMKRTYTLKDGRVIVCESQQVNYGAIRQHLQMKLKLPELPDYGIDGDQNGDQIAFSQDQVVSATSEPFRFVDRKFFTGRVLKVWWPLARERPVR